MTWSYEESRLEVTGCEPKRACAGSPITLAIEGYYRGVQRESGAWFARLVPIEAEAGAVTRRAAPADLGAVKVDYRPGEGDSFAVTARFDLPPTCGGRYQLVLGCDDAAAGEHARFLVDADDSDGAFVIT